MFKFGFIKKFILFLSEDFVMKSSKLTAQCPYCKDWFKNSRGLGVHLRTCTKNPANISKEEKKPSPRSSPFQNEEDRLTPWVERRSKEQKEAKERYLKNYSKKEKKSPW